MILLMKNMALDIAWRLYGIPYRWGGDDPIQGFDCSGFIVEILRSLGILPLTGDWTAATLFEHFSANREPHPEECFLVFWKGDHGIRHVEMCLNEILSIGASGGGSGVLSEVEAAIANAYIKVRPILGRGEIAGYVDPFL